MPNYAKREQETLSTDQLALARQSRQPVLGGLDDTALLALIADLHDARSEAASGQEGSPGPAEMLRAALRRADTERRKRGLRLTPAVQAPAPAAVTLPKTAPPSKRKRKSAAKVRTPADRKTAETRKADLRTEPHRLPKRQAKPAAVQTHVEVDSPTDKDAAKAARKADKRAAKKAEKDAAKAARQAQKDAAKADRRADRKAARQVEKDAEKAARKATRQAASDSVDAKASKRAKEGGGKSAKRKRARADSAPDPKTGDGAT